MSDKLDSNRKVLQHTISADLFGAAGLCEPAEIEVPEKYDLLCLSHGICDITISLSARSHTANQLT